MRTKKITESTIKHLMGTYRYMTRVHLNMLIDTFTKSKITHRIKETKDLLQIYSFYESQGKSDSDIATLWTDTWLEKYKRRAQYKLNPVRERRDNQNPETYGINFGSSGCNGNKIRIPSKKHKNRYKNFLKLFPQFKEKNG